MTAINASMPLIVDGRLQLLSATDLVATQRLKSGKSFYRSETVGGQPCSYVLRYDPEHHVCRWEPISCLTEGAGHAFVFDLNGDWEVVSCGDEDPVRIVPLGFSQFNPISSSRILLPHLRKLTNTAAPLDLETFNAEEFISKRRRSKYSLKTRIPLNAATGYVLGLICGDGWAVVGRNIFYGVAVAKVRKDVMRKFNDCLPEFFEDQVPPCMSRATTQGNYGESMKHAYASAELGRLVESVCGHGARQKHLPDFFVCAPREFRLGLFAGLMDSDGSISISCAKKKPQLMASFTSTSTRMIREVRLLAMGLGIPGKITPTTTPAGRESEILSFSNIAVQNWGGNYMANQDRLKNLFAVPPILPSGALDAQDLVPVSPDLAKTISQAIGAPKITKEMRANPTDEVAAKKAAVSLSSVFRQASKHWEAKCGVVSRRAALRALALPRVQAIFHPDMAVLKRHVANTDISWIRATGAV